MLCLTDIGRVSFLVLLAKESIHSPLVLIIESVLIEVVPNDLPLLIWLLDLRSLTHLYRLIGIHRMHLMPPALLASTELLNFVTSSLDLQLQDVFRIRVVHNWLKK